MPYGSVGRQVVDLRIGKIGPRVRRQLPEFRHPVQVVMLRSIQDKRHDDQGWWGGGPPDWQRPTRDGGRERQVQQLSQGGYDVLLTRRVREGVLADVFWPDEHQRDLRVVVPRASVHEEVQ